MEDISEKNNIYKVSSKYILHNIFSFLDYNKALNIMKYNKKLQNTLNIKLDDYSIDYSLNIVKEKEEYGEYRINNTPDIPDFLAIFNLIIKFIFFISICLCLRYWITKFFNIILIINNVYVGLSIFYILTRYFFGVKDIECKKCFTISQIVDYSIILIILIIKFFFEKNEKVNALDIINIITLIFCFLEIIFSIFSIINVNKQDDDNNKGLIRNYRLVDNYIITVKKIRGYKIDKKIIESKSIIKFNLASLNHYYYTLNNKQLYLIKLINKKRTKNRLTNLKYKKNQNLGEAFFIIKRFFSIGTIFKINHKDYLLVYPMEELINIKLEKDKEINDILLLTYINYIIILEKEDKQYILLFENKEEDIKENSEILTLDNIKVKF